jgi:hypothetical protein
MTPDARTALAAALRQIETTRKGGEYPHLGGGNQRSLAAAILAAMPDWTLIEREDEQMLTPAPDAWAELSAKVRRQEAEIARLRAALTILLPAIEHNGIPHPNHNQACHDADAKVLRAALAPSEPQDNPWARLAGEGIEP